jgi:hypothetical protein
VAKRKFTGVAGLPLARRAIRLLKDRGIFAHALVSVEHQQLAGRYVLRGLESGGSVGDVGRYVTFTGGDGRQLECLHQIDAIAVNGLHAVVISPEFVRVDILRKGRTYELLITRHFLQALDNGDRPQLKTDIVFRGIHGRLELDLCGKDKHQAGSVVPSFLSLAGESVLIPEKFIAVVRAATKAVNCAGCSHSHYLRKPSLRSRRAAEDGSDKTAGSPSAQEELQSATQT